MMILEIVLELAYAYLACGCLFAIPFLWKGLGRIDEGARGAGISFRFMILPGTILLWPILFIKWIRVKKNHEPHA
jgi:hypothetical protein